QFIFTKIIVFPCIFVFHFYFKLNRLFYKARAYKYHIFCSIKHTFFLQKMGRNVCASYGANMEPSPLLCQNTGPAARLYCAEEPASRSYLFHGPAVFCFHWPSSLLPGTGIFSVGTQLWQLAASQPGAHCACTRNAALCQWPRSLVGPITCPTRLWGGRGEDHSMEVGAGT
ncbi:unnamed protein product, partial [Staurois parvus]